MLEDVDLNRVAKRVPVRPRRRGLGPPLHAAGSEQPAPSARAHPAAGDVHLRRIHAASQPTRGNRPGPRGAGRQRGDRQPPDRQPGVGGR